MKGIQFAVALSSLLFAAAAQADHTHPLPVGVQVNVMDPYKTLSSEHTSYGISQMLAGDVGEGFVNLRNPGPADHTASVLTYQDRHFLQCQNVEVAPHSQVQVTVAPLSYAEVVSVPTEPIELRVWVRWGARPPYWKVSRNVEGEFIVPWLYDNQPIVTPQLGVPRLRFSSEATLLQVIRWADGLGLSSPELDLVHPTLWNLPANSGDRQAALDCMCGAGDLWDVFGVICQ